MAINPAETYRSTISSGIPQGAQGGPLSFGVKVTMMSETSAVHNDKQCPESGDIWLRHLTNNKYLTLFEHLIRPPGAS